MSQPDNSSLISVRRDIAVAPPPDTTSCQPRVRVCTPRTHLARHAVARCSVASALRNAMPFDPAQSA